MWHAVACGLVMWRAVTCGLVMWHAVTCGLVMWHAIACGLVMWPSLLPFRTLCPVVGTMSPLQSPSLWSSSPTPVGKPSWHMYAILITPLSYLPHLFTHNSSPIPLPLPLLTLSPNLSLSLSSPFPLLRLSTIPTSLSTLHLVFHWTPVQHSSFSLLWQQSCLVPTLQIPPGSFSGLADSEATASKLHGNNNRLTNWLCTWWPLSHAQLGTTKPIPISAQAGWPQIQALFSNAQNSSRGDR